MGQIKDESLYERDNPVHPQDKVIGSDFNNFGKTKNFFLTDIRDYVLDGTIASQNMFTVINGFSIVGNVLTIDAGWEWIISNNTYTNAGAVSLNVPFASAGKKRIDLVLANTNNTHFTLKQGVETTGIPVTPSPELNTLPALYLIVDDNGVDTETPVDIGAVAIEKVEKKYVDISGSGAIDIELTNKKAIVYLSGTITSLDSVNIDNSCFPYTNKKYAFVNTQATSITLKHNAGIKNTKFIFPDGVDKLLKTGEIAEFYYNFGTLSYIGLSVGGVINLGYEASPTNGVVTSDNGTDAIIPLVDVTNAGLMSPEDKATIDDLGAVATSNEYGDLDNIPSTFPPTAHTHPSTDITDFSTAAQTATISQSITDGVTDKAPSENEVFDALASKQATLVSGTNIKTINGNSLLGAGDLSITLGVTTSVTSITSANILTQDVDGFVVYINGVTPFSTASNEVRFFKVTDTGQEFMLIPNGRSFGSGQTAITDADVLLIKDIDFRSLFPVQYTYQGTGTGIATLGTNVLFFQGTQSDTLPAGGGYSYRRIASAATAGTSIHAREASFGRVLQNMGYYFEERFRIADASLITDVRTFFGMYIITAFGNTDISASVNPMMGIGCDGADTNLQIIHQNVTSGGVTKVNLGSNFPKVQTNEYLYKQYRMPNSNITVYEVTNITTGQVAKGSVTNNPTTLTVNNHRNNNASNLACAFEIQRIILRT